MSAAPSNEVLQRRANIALIAAFLVLLWMPTADALLKLDHAPRSDENRALAEYPKFTFHLNLRRIGELLGQYQQYFNDHFGFRRMLVHLEHRWKWTLFRDMRSDMAIAGKAGWLFYCDRRTIKDLQGEHPFSDAELANWQALLTARRDWLRQRGIRYLLVVPPDKHSIYPEFLPNWLASAMHPPRRIDQFFAHMKAHSDIPVLNLRDVLLREKGLVRVYKMTDTHWNDRGAFAAYKLVMDSLTALGSRGTTMNPADFWETVSEAPSGDLALILRQQARLSEKGNITLQPAASLPMPVRRMDETQIQTLWLSGREPLIFDNAARSGRIVVFHDSFMVAMAQFFGHSFQRTALVWQQNWNKEFIEREKPDIVMDEMLERFLISRDPLKLQEADEQPGKMLRGE